MMIKIVEYSVSTVRFYIEITQLNNPGFYYEAGWLNHLTAYIFIKSVNI